MRSTATQAPFFGPTTPGYPAISTCVRVVAQSGPVYAGFAQQWPATNPPSLRDREQIYVWEPNGIPLRSQIYSNARLIGSFPPDDDNALPLYVVDAVCCDATGSPAGSSLSSAVSILPAPSVTPSVSPSPTVGPSALPSNDSLNPSFAPISLSATSPVPTAPGCNPATCGVCPANSTPLSWLITASGFSRSPCTGLNGSFIVYYVGSVAGSCVWQSLEMVSGLPAWRLVLSSAGVWALESMGAIYSSLIPAPQAGGCGAGMTFGAGHFIPRGTTNCSTPNTISVLPLTACPGGGGGSGGSSSPSGTTTSCCPGVLLPNALTMTIFGDGTGGCPDLTFNLTLQPGGFWQSASLPFGSCGIVFTLTCLGNSTWQLTLNINAGSEIDNYSPTSASCSPFALGWNVNIPKTCGNCQPVPTQIIITST